MKQRFTETFIYDKNTFSKIKKVRGSALAESHIKKVLKEKKIIDEGKSKNFYEFPISKYDFVNANNRDYPKKLWENVIKNQKAIWKGGVGLADHPENEGFFKDSVIVWTDMRISESDNLVYATGAFVGPYGKMCEEIIDTGGRVGFSSSGFGELMDESTVDPDTYEIERVADVVLNPSQGVFGDATHKQNESKSFNGIKESSIKKESASMPGTKISKIEEKKFKKDVQVFIEDAKKHNDPRQKIGELNDIKVYLEDNKSFDSSSTFMEEINKLVESTESELKEFIESSIDLKVNLGVDNSEDLKQKLEMIHEDSKTLKANVKDWEKISETLAQRNKKLKDKLTASPTMREQKSLLATIKKLESEKRNTVKKFRAFEKEAIKANSKLMKAYKEQGAKLVVLDENLEIEKRKNKHLIKENYKLVNAEKSRVNNLREAKKQEIREAIDKKKAAQDPIKKFYESEFSEEAQVESYYADLVLKHGSAIAPFRRKILSENTVKGAMSVYFKIRDGLTNVDRIPESSLIGNKSRTKMLESKGIKLVDRDSKLANMPEGWN